MARTCVCTPPGGTAARGTWNLAGTTLSVTPEGEPPRVFDLGEMSSFGGDGYALDFRLGGDTLRLEKLGADGQTLLQDLRRTWPALRAGALRLAGTGDALPFSGTWARDGGAPVPALILFYDDVLLAAPGGGDLEPLFFSGVRGVAFDADAYTVTLSGYTGARHVFGRLAGRTEAFYRRALTARGALASEALTVLTAALPTVDAARRSALAALWPPGRVVSIAELERACPGFRKAFEDSWLSGAARKTEGMALLTSAGEDDLFLGFGRPGGAGGDEADNASAPTADEDQGDAEAGDAAEAVPPPGGAVLWLLARRKEAWVLEALTEANRATYRFEGGDEIPSLVSLMLSAPQFSREALYLPLESLTGDRASLAAAARDLAPLAALRTRFKGRVIHKGFAGWSKALGL